MVLGTIARERRDLMLENESPADSNRLARLAHTPRDRSARHRGAAAPQCLAALLDLAQPGASRPGRPRIDPEVATLIRRMTAENRRWGNMRVLGELRKLGFSVSLQTVRRYRKDVPRDPASSWRTFLENHRPSIWAAAFITMHTLLFKTLYVFFVTHDRRTMMHVNVTRHPKAAWLGVS